MKLRFQTIIIVLFVLVVQPKVLQAQEEGEGNALIKQSLNEVADDGESQPEPSTFLGEFKKLDISYIGSTQNCVGYDVYAIKYWNSWFMAIAVKDSPKMTVFLEKPPRTEAVLPPVSEFVVEGLHGCIVNDYVKKKSRRKKVNDLQLFGFYKLRKQGRKVVKGVLLVEFPDDVNKESNFFLFKMFKGLFGGKLEEMKPEMPEPPEIPNIEEKIEEKADEQIEAVK